MTLNKNAERQARIVGRTLRLALGIALIWLTIEIMQDQNVGFYVRVAAVIVLLAALYSAILFAVNRYASNVNPWLGAALALVPAALVYVLGGAVGRVATVVYIGVSLVLQSVRGDGGCEVMAMPAVLLGRRTGLVCLVFSPVDWAEGYVAARLARRKQP